MSACVLCGKDGASTKCPQCRVATYCNKDCLKKHKKHKKSGECATLANARTEEVPAASGKDSKLLTADGVLTPDFQTVLVELFQRFDVDGDGHLSEAELKAYSGAANADGREFESEELEQITGCFDWVQGKGLSIDGWLDMYHTQTGGDEDETWGDLRHLGYDGNLQLK
eukprot:TRINITY_DN2258_c0_g4_i1.p1 TRINITY_DN2258_c0_g4~~TRINITY_DN2258_c0_g4_i1.p1  ORF type:complete len:169 (-),score=43.26 TRINITY_DN2258_c0_g4_i1:268-774(-)